METNPAWNQYLDGTFGHLKPTLQTTETLAASF